MGRREMGEDVGRAIKIYSIYDVGEEQNLLMKNLNINKTIIYIT